MSVPLLIVNARLWSGSPLAADAVLVRAGRIAALGRTRELRGAVPDAREVDAGGGTVTPGLTDAHLHFVPWARARRQPDLSGTLSCAEALSRVASALAAMPPGELPLVGRGWDDGVWETGPDRAALDTLAPTRPVLLHRHDFHTLWVNGAALRVAGISRHTPDPPGGRFERDAAGELTGLVREHAVRAFAAVEDGSGLVTDDQLLDDAAAVLHAAGITCVHDFQRNHDDWRRMRSLAGRGRLRVLQHVGPEQVAEAVRLGLAGGEGDDWFRTGSLKLFADGTLGSRTAALLERYEDESGTGLALLSRRELTQLVGQAAAAGFSVAIHAIGDAAVRDSLDAIQAHRTALARLPLAPRIEHVQLLSEADLPRFAALGITASMQPQHATTDAPVARRAWGARCHMAYPWRALLASSARLAFGSDAPVEPPQACLGLASAVARVDAEGIPFEHGQRITLDEALRAYTCEGSRLAGGGLGPGTLTTGAPADLVVWDRDLHQGGGADLARARPRLTTLAGDIVYDSHLALAVAGADAPLAARSPTAED
jgi:predicted amidohydrolase YtcJ